jgi:ABC-type multidrug transport system fused ATPase/permease subunit
MTYLKPYRFKFGVGMFFLVLSSLAMLAFPALLGAMIDAAQGKQLIHGLHHMFIILVELPLLFCLFYQSSLFFVYEFLLRLPNVRYPHYARILISN